MVYFNLYRSHGMSYPISGLVESYPADDHNPDKPLVVMSASVLPALLSLILVATWIICKLLS